MGSVGLGPRCHPRGVGVGEGAGLGGGVGCRERGHAGVVAAGSG